MQTSNTYIFISWKVDSLTSTLCFFASSKQMSSDIRLVEPGRQSTWTFTIICLSLSTNFKVSIDESTLKIYTHLCTITHSYKNTRAYSNHTMFQTFNDNKIFFSIFYALFWNDFTEMWINLVKKWKIFTVSTNFLSHKFLLGKWQHRSKVKLIETRT